MRKSIIAATAVLTLGLAGAASAQEGTVSGAAGGAVTGAIVGGPVGAAVGGIAGAALGTAIDPPPREVVTYVREQPVAAPVVVERKVVVGEALPETVVVTPVPQHQNYAYAVVNEQRVIVDTNSHKVVQIVD